jgi:hypothetical protein
MILGTSESKDIILWTIAVDHVCEMKFPRGIILSGP